MALKRRLINVQFLLGEGDFGTGGANAVELVGHRVRATINKAGGNVMNAANLQIYGMARDQMNRLATLGIRPMESRRNTLVVLAGDEDDGVAQIFVGQIQDAYVDYAAAPQVAFTVTAYTGLFEAVLPIVPSSFPGPSSVVTMLETLATKMNKRFENGGVDTGMKLSSPYYPGSAREQAIAIVRDAGIEWNGLDQDVLAIWPPGGTRDGTAPLLSPETGMVGYPAWTSVGIIVKSLFNKSIQVGGKIEVKTSVPQANGTWAVNMIDYHLDSMVPRGDWFMTIQAAREGSVVRPTVGGVR